MAVVHAEAQSSLPLIQPQGVAGPPVLITLQDAIDRAQKLDSQYLASVTDAQVALEDRRQAKSAMLPQLSGTVQDLTTQGNGLTPSGRFITNDGVHVYRAWGVVRQDLSPNTYLQTGYQRAQVAEAIARTRVDVARFGLETIVNRNYYALIVAQRKYATAQQAVQQAQRFLDVSQQQERLGQVARADVVKADLQYQQQLQNYNDLKLVLENARLNLAVMLFPTLNENFAVVDDMDSAIALPPFPEVQALAEKQNPDLRVATLAISEAGLDVKNARNAFLPSISIDADYGIEANAFALHSTAAADPEAGILPNLGFFITGTLNVPIWDWRGLSSKLKQARLRRSQAEVQLSQTRRQLVANLYTAYNEVLAAQSAVATMRHAAELATESLRLTTLRYQAGESTALEVVDAQNALVTVRNAYDEALARARLAISTLRTLTGGF
jgi:outer membrane protein